MGAKAEGNGHGPGRGLRLPTDEDPWAGPRRGLVTVGE